MRHIKASFFNLQIKNNFPENCYNDKCPFDISLYPSLLSYSKYNTDNKNILSSELLSYLCSCHSGNKMASCWTRF